MRADRLGFTMIELLIVTVLGTLILVATLQVLITNQRIYTAQNSQIRGTQSTRGTLAVLSSELREISPRGGDLVVMKPDTVGVRAMRAFGVVCHDTLLGVPAFRAFVLGDSIATGDSVLVLADNNSLKSWDDAWIATSVTAVTYGTSCGASAASQHVVLSNAPAFLADSVSSGAEIRAFTHISYGLVGSGGAWYLGQSIAGGSWEPVIGPLRDANGLLFEYLDETGNPTATATDVTMIVVTVRTGGEVYDSNNNLVEDSVSVRIHTRN